MIRWCARLISSPTQQRKESGFFLKADSVCQIAFQEMAEISFALHPRYQMPSSSSILGTVFHIQDSPEPDIVYVYRREFDFDYHDLIMLNAADSPGCRPRSSAVQLSGKPGRVQDFTSPGRGKLGCAQASHSGSPHNQTEYLQAYMVIHN